MPAIETRSTSTTPLAERPFDPKGVPFFYGWIIVGSGVLGVLMSIPGQTLGVSVFTDYLTEALGLSRMTLSIAYLVATVSSALILSYAGRLYDRFGSRIVAGAAAIGLGLVLLLLTQVDRAAAAIGTLMPRLASAVPAFVLICAGFFGIRFFGQGVLTMSSNNMVVKWFDRRRGLAMGVVGVFMSFGFSGAPRLLDWLISAYGWRGAWLVCAVTVGLAFPVVVFVLFRDNPEQCGMEPDGPLREPKTKSTSWTRQAPHPMHDATLAQARRTYPFWIFGGSLFLFALYTTGMTFHVVSIFEEAGLSRTQAVSIFLPASVISVIVRFSAGLISDYVKLKYLLMIQLLGVVISTISLSLLGSNLSIAGLIVGNGITSGMFGLVATITWPQFYGRTHLGAITGFIMALQVAGSAVGPYVFSVSLGATGGYAGAAVGCLIVAVGLLAASPKAERPDESWWDEHSAQRVSESDG